MKRREKLICVIICQLVGIATVVRGDLYLHSPRGSNNRLNEKSANRANANRVFDSQVKSLLKMFDYISICYKIMHKVVNLIIVSKIKPAFVSS